MSATPVLFGAYTISTITALAGTGTVTLSCTVTGVALLDTWTLSLSAGNSGNFAQRQMKNGSNILLYNLYTSATLTSIWGDGTGGSSTVSQLQLLSVGTSNYPYTIYGVVNALQDKPAGTYSDTITVTVTY